MNRWQKLLAGSVVAPDELSSLFTVDTEPLVQVVKRYPMRITRHYLGLIEKPGDAIWRQCVPDLLELEDESQAEDPLDEEQLSPVPGLIHRYPDRVVWLVSSVCAVYCRFCMRKRRVGCTGIAGPGTRQAALAYIGAHPEIRDVVLSGGDPLLNEDDVLEEILAGLRLIPHLEIVRIGTRVPVTLPERITAGLCRMLKKFHPLYINTHFNHPREITAASARACARLADAGIPLGNQSVLLKGVNDDPQVMKRLMQLLLSIRVRPYYLHQMDLVKGTAHFRTSINRGLEIMEGLRGHTSGMASPYYAVDLAGGKGKVPLLPGYVRREDDALLFRSYRGEVVRYRDVDES
ncbi:KamA family radical SAM protein [Geotalea sp. SG265]|uniref:KamA family radical SAM protein n=1 Tax=Geotalea sp. SG265 TaxID=2922867 RepID=UPI001FAFF561|nr:KamA family radical SAM protein [Geotalea sp. SG265]